MYKKIKKLPLQLKIISLVCITIFVSLIISAVLVRDYIINKEYQETEDKITLIARTISKAPVVIDILTEKKQSLVAQEYADEIQKSTNIDFVVILDNDLIRYSHPDKSVLGMKFSNVEDASKSLNGTEHFSIKEGVLGDGIRIFVPVFNDNNIQIGMVCVGMTIKSINQDIFQAQETIFYGVSFSFVIGIIGAILISRNVKKALFNLEPHEIAASIEQKRIIEDSVKEGIIAITKDRSIIHVNNEANKIMTQLSIDRLRENDMIGFDHPLYPLFKNVFENGNRAIEYTLTIDEYEFIVYASPIFYKNEFYGIVTTFKDQSMIKDLINKLNESTHYTEALRSQTHDFMNKMHVVNGLIDLKKYDEVKKYISMLSDDNQSIIDFITKRIKTSIFAGFFIGKISELNEQNITLNIDSNSYIPSLTLNDTIYDFIIIVGNLIDNAKEELISSNIENKVILIKCNYDDNNKLFTIIVEDNGRGIANEKQSKIFIDGFSTKGDNRGIGLSVIKSKVIKYNGSISIESVINKYTRFTISFYNREDEEL